MAIGNAPRALREAAREYAEHQHWVFDLDRLHDKQRDKFLDHALKQPLQERVHDENAREQRRDDDGEAPHQDPAGTKQLQKLLDDRSIFNYDAAMNAPKKSETTRNTILQHGYILVQKRGFAALGLRSASHSCSGMLTSTSKGLRLFRPTSRGGRG